MMGKGLVFVVSQLDESSWMQKPCLDVQLGHPSRETWGMVRPRLSWGILRMGM